MRVHGAWLCAVAVVGAAVLAGCTPTLVTKFDVADGLQKQAKYTEAIGKYTEFIRDNEYPRTSAYAMYNIALCYKGLGNKQAALDAYKKVMEQYPGTEAANWAGPEMRELEKMTLTPAPVPAPKSMPAPKPVEKKTPPTAPAK